MWEQCNMVFCCFGAAYCGMEEQQQVVNSVQRKFEPGQDNYWCFLFTAQCALPASWWLAGGQSETLREDQIPPGTCWRQHERMSKLIFLKQVENSFLRPVAGEAGEVRWWFQLRTGMAWFPHIFLADLQQIWQICNRPVYSDCKGWVKIYMQCKNGQHGIGWRTP